MHAHSGSDWPHALRSNHASHLGSIVFLGVFVRIRPSDRDLSIVRGDGDNWNVWCHARYRMLGGRDQVDRDAPVGVREDRRNTSPSERLVQSFSVRRRLPDLAEGQ